MNLADRSFFEKIMSKVLSKLTYADKQGLEDLMWVMSELNLDAHKNLILENWRKKNVETLSCKLDAWKVDHYKIGEIIQQKDIF